MLSFIKSKIQVVKKNKNLLSGLAYSLFYFFNRGIGFILMIILARYIMPADYGKLSMYNTIFTVMGFMWAFASRNYTTIAYFRDGEHEYKKYFTAVNVLSLTSLLFFSVLAFFFNDAIASALDIPSHIIYYPAIITFITTITSLQQDYFRMKEKLKFFGIISCGGAVIDMCSALLMVVFLGYGWLGRVYSSFVGCAIFGAIAIIFFIKNQFFVFDFTKKRYKSLILFGLPLIPQLSTTWLTQGCDQYIINHYYSSFEVGIFCMALNLMSVIEMIGFSFNNSNSITLYKILSDNNIVHELKLLKLKKETRTIFASLMLLIALYILIACVFLPILMPAYSDCIPLFLILSFFGILRCVYLLYCNYLYYYKETKFLMWSIVIPSLLHLLLSLLLTQYSLYLTAAIFIATQLIIVLIVYKKAKFLVSNNIK